MARSRFFVSIAFVMLISVGFAIGQEGAGVEDAVVGAPQANPVVLGGVEICGPVYEALLFLGPRDASGKLDPSRIGLWPHPSGLYRVTFRPSAGVGKEFAGQPVSMVALGEFKGRTQGITLTWNYSGEVLQGIWSMMNKSLRSVGGEADEESDGSAMWVENALRTIISLDVESGFADITYFCKPTEDEVLARLESAPETDVPPATAEASNAHRTPERMLGQSVLSVLGVRGEPAAEPSVRGPGKLGLYFEGVEVLGVPCNTWSWFVDGETVYEGAEFAAPFGERNALEVFDGFSEILSRSFGEPFASIGGKGFDRIRTRWLNGVEEIVLTLELVGDPPWFRFEVIDRVKHRMIEGDLWPDRKPIRDFVPQPRDSGKTREALASGDARG